MKTENAQISVGFVSLGCPKNTVDSEKMLAQIAEAGFLVGADPNQADVAVINTCGFIAPAKQEASEVVSGILEAKRNGDVQKVVVVGCLVERMKDAILDELPGIDALVGLGQRDDIAKVIKQTFESSEPKSYYEHYDRAGNDKGRLLSIAPHWAYLRISEGCNHKCSFCTIPSIRGKFRSKPMDTILEEARELADSGVVELNLIAQDTSWYGKDLKMRDGLAKLLNELVRVEGIEWIRLLYMYPTGLKHRLIKTIAENEKIVPYLDIPLQHINDDILKAMKRPERKEKIVALIEKLRKSIPEIVLRTTFIVGFPGETNEQFMELLDFVKEARFDAMGAFTYFAEDGTPAAKLPEKVPDDVKEQRLEELMLAQQEIAFEKNRERRKSQLRCLVDARYDAHTVEARYWGQAPEIDSLCFVHNCTAEVGEFITAEVIGTKDYDLEVRQVSG